MDKLHCLSCIVVTGNTGDKGPEGSKGSQGQKGKDLLMTRNEYYSSWITISQDGQVNNGFIEFEGKQEIPGLIAEGDEVYCNPNDPNQTNINITFSSDKDVKFYVEARLNIDLYTRGYWSNPPIEPNPFGSPSNPILTTETYESGDTLMLSFFLLMGGVKFHVHTYGDTINYSIRAVRIV